MTVAEPPAPRPVIEAMAPMSKTIKVALAGAGCALVGQLWGVLFPINKRLWTSSYVVLTAGIAIVLLVLGVNLLGNGLRETLDPRRADRR